MEKLANYTARGLTTLQIEIAELSKITLQNLTALDTTLASQGGVRTTLNASRRMRMDHSGELLTDVHEIWEISSRMRQVPKDDTSQGFTDTVSGLTSQVPDLSVRLKKALAVAALAIVGIVRVIAIFQSCITCFSSIVAKWQGAWRYK